jgi:hypothetical protein
LAKAGDCGFGVFDVATNLPDEIPRHVLAAMKRLVYRTV